MADPVPPFPFLPERFVNTPYAELPPALQWRVKLWTTEETARPASIPVTPEG